VIINNVSIKDTLVMITGMEQNIHLSRIYATERCYPPHTPPYNHTAYPIFEGFCEFTNECENSSLPATVHNTAISTLFDDICASASFYDGAICFTASLTI